MRGVADEGGFWPVFDTNEAVLEVLVEAIEAAGYEPGGDVGISLDIAATDLYRDGGYHLALEDRVLPSAAFVEMIAGWVDRYPIISLEDPLAEEDWSGWELAATRLKDRVQLVGDDLFTTHVDRIDKGVDLGVANAVLIQAEPDRDGERGHRRHSPHARGGVGAGGLSPLGRDGGHFHRPPGRGVRLRPAEGRVVHAQRAHGQVERSAAHRGAAERPRALLGSAGISVSVIADPSPRTAGLGPSSGGGGRERWLPLFVVSGRLVEPLEQREIFYTLTEAMILIERWRREYNTVRPHSALGYRPPAPEAVRPVSISGFNMSPALS